MPIQQEGALESCRRVQTMLREVQQLALVPQAETLTECEAQLGTITILLEALHRFITEETAKDGPTALTHIAALRPVLRQIQHTARKLRTQFDHGSNYCMGLLQLRLGTGYSERGLPVLIPSQARSSFEG